MVYKGVEGIVNMLQAYIPDKKVRDLYHKMTQEEREDVLRIINSGKGDIAKYYDLVKSNERISNEFKRLGLYIKKRLNGK